MIELGPNDPIDLHEFVDSRRVRAEAPGVRRLCLALLVDAIQCYNCEPLATGRNVSRVGLKRDAQNWFEARGDDIFSFEMVCDVLGIVAPKSLWRRIREQTVQVQELPRRSPSYISEKIGGQYTAAGADA